jgi:hypothetical protein
MRSIDYCKVILYFYNEFSRFLLEKNMFNCTYAHRKIINKILEGRS